MRLRLYLARLIIGLTLLAGVSFTSAFAGSQADANTEAPEQAAGQVHPAAEHGDKAVHGASAGEHDQPNVLGGDLGNIFFTLLIFLIVVFILGKYAWKPVLNILQERERTIRESLESARREREQAQALLEKHQQQIDHAREEATAIVEEGKRDAQEVARQVQVEARKEGERMIARARREIQLAKDTAVKELYDRTAELTLQAAGQVIGKALSPEEHQALVAESLERMKSAEKPELN